MTANERDALLWWKSVRARTNESFRPLLFEKSRYLVLMGGAGSGKSVFAGEKLLARATSEPDHRFLVCRKVARSMRESVIKQLLSQLSENFPRVRYSYSKTDGVIEFENGSQIIFSGLDDVEKLKSIYDITGIWIEEASEITEQDFNQLDIRLRGETKYYKQIILSFNPVSVNHWLRGRFFDKRCPDAFIHRSTYRDNRFLDAEAVRVLESYRDTDTYYYTVYCLGEWGVTGKSVFPSGAIAGRLAELKHLPRPFEGYFEKTENGKYELTEEDGGAVKIFAPPAEYTPYVIGADTAGEGSDYFAAQVINNLTGVQAAILRMQEDEDEFVRQLNELGNYYNGALIAVETNFSTYPVKRLSALGYKRLYVHEDEESFDGRMGRSFGFRTTRLTRPVIISELIKAVRDDVRILNDETTMLEMLSFVRNAHLRPEAEYGAHDDCVMALAIAHHARHQQSFSPLPPEPKKWTQSQWEDYRNASREERRYLISIWGDPKR